MTRDGGCLMCECAKHNRKSRLQHAVAIATTSSLLIAANPRRWAVLISAPTANALTVSLGPTAVAAEGIRLAAGQSPLYLTHDDYGCAIHEQLTAIMETAGTTIGVWEILDMGAEQWQDNPTPIPSTVQRRPPFQPYGRSGRTNPG